MKWVNMTSGTIQIERSQEGILSLALSGRLDSTSVGSIWMSAANSLSTGDYTSLVVDASEVDYCDGSGLAFLVNLLRRARVDGKSADIQGLREQFSQQLDRIPLDDLLDPVSETTPTVSIPEQVGEATVGMLGSLRELITFTGEIVVVTIKSLRHPSTIRWKDVWLVVEKSGTDAIPIIALVNFLIGLILAFQSAIAMKMFGAEVYVGTLVSIAVVRELGPLMTAILLAARTGSAFAAEIGTMKVNEEIDALTTMGLDPTRFLVVTRVLAATFVTPLLTLIAILLGVLGGAVVFSTFDYSMVNYWHQIQSIVDYTDLFGGLLKVVVFGAIVAGVGCLRGLQTGQGASAVGDSTTRAVVSGIVLIVAVDGVFGTLYYVLGI
jgi:phospholipid/cholesterol/gamma-HCH transport system permease protein